MSKKGWKKRHRADGTLRPWVVRRSRRRAWARSPFVAVYMRALADHYREIYRAWIDRVWPSYLARRS